MDAKDELILQLAEHLCRASEELKRVAEDAVRGSDNRRLPTDKYDNAASKLARAWLAEHDETPLSAERLEAEFALRGIPVALMRCPLEYAPRTLGELRQLCNRLGIALTPP